MTLVELLVAISTGVIVMTGITVAMIVTMRETERVSSHVEANQNARLTMTKILAELHSACVAPQLAPIQGESTGTNLVFLHQTGAAVAPLPILSKITLSGTTLSQSNYQATGGAAPSWTFPTSPTSTEILMKGVNQVGTTPLFAYYAYSGAKISSTRQTTPLESRAASTSQVSITFSTSPTNSVSGDTNAATTIQDAALLRLTPPGYSSSANNLPCQ